MEEVVDGKPSASAELLEAVQQAAIRLAEAPPQEIIHWALEEFEDTLSIATGFGAEGMALIDMAVRMRPRTDIFFLDTGFLFPDTYDLRERAEQRYGISIRAVRGELSPEQQAEHLGDGLWLRNPDLCCHLRKVEPMHDALADCVAWMAAIRRDQTAARANAKPVEWDARWHRVKVNPLVNWTRREVWQYIFKHDVPYNPLHDQGYPSIGCSHCTRAVGSGEDERAGRWQGSAKTECGLHVVTGARRPREQAPVEVPAPVRLVG